MASGDLQSYPALPSALNLQPQQRPSHHQQQQLPEHCPGSSPTTPSARFSHMSLTSPSRPDAGADPQEQQPQQHPSQQPQSQPTPSILMTEEDTHMLFGTPPNPGSDATPWTMSDVYFPNFDCNTPPAPPPLARRGHQMVSTPQQQSTPPAQQQHHQHQHQLLHPYHRQQQQQQPPPPSPAFYLRTPPHPQVAVVQPARRQLAMPATPAEAMGCFAPPSNFQLAGEAVAYRGADGLSATDMYLTATGQPHATLPTYDDEVDSDNEDKTLRSLAEAVGLGSSHAHQHLLQQTAEDLAASSHHFGLGSDPMLGPAPGTLRGPLPSSRRRSRNQQRVAQSVTIASWLAQHFEANPDISLPRSLPFDCFMAFCRENGMEEMNAATFGKHMRQVFPLLKVRRLGTRGQSKYHYQGVAMKANSPYQSVLAGQRRHWSQIEQDGDGLPSGGGEMTSRPSSAQQQLLQQQHQQQQQTAAAAVATGVAAATTAAVMAAAAGGHVLSPLSTTVASSILSQPQTPQTVPVTSGVGPHLMRLPLFPSLVSLNIREDTALDKLTRFVGEMYAHCQKMFVYAQLRQFQRLRPSMLQFWSDVPQVLQPLLSMPAVVDYIAVCENIFYNGVLLALLPNVFASQNLVEIRSLRRLARDWLPWCLESCAPLPLPLSEGRMAVARLFSATLQRQTSLNHLAEAVRILFVSPPSLATVDRDLAGIDTAGIQAQIDAMGGGDTFLAARQLLVSMPAILKQKSLEKMIRYFADIIGRSVPTSQAAPTYVAEVKKFLAITNFATNLYLRELRRTNAASFSAMHLLKTLFDEYVMFLMDRRHAASTMAEVRVRIGIEDPQASPWRRSAMPHGADTGGSVPCTPRPLTNCTASAAATPYCPTTRAPLVFDFKQDTTAGGSTPETAPGTAPQTGDSHHVPGDQQMAMPNLSHFVELPDPSAFV